MAGCGEGEAVVVEEFDREDQLVTEQVTFDFEGEDGFEKGEQPTRTVVKMLREAGWTPTTTSGSHTKWISPKGAPFTLPDGHKTISPGVYRKLLKTIEEDR